jgi:Spermine/spermidine synthase domain
VNAADQAGSRRFYFEIFVISFAALLLEISYTRLISFKLFYYYTYLVIGFALLGIGSGGVVVAVRPRLARVPLDRLLAAGSLAASLAIALGYLTVALLPTATAQLSKAPVIEITKLMLICTALFSSFFPMGVMISALLGRNPARIARLYFADLVGAAAACAVAVPLQGSLTPPGCILLAALLLAVLAVRLARPWSLPLLAASLAAGALLLAGIAFPRTVPEPVTDAAKALRPDTPRLFSAWNPVFRIDVVAVLSPELRLIYHDGQPGSALHRFDGNVASLTRFQSDPRSYAFRIGERPVRRVLIVGAAGGHEILTSLYFEAEQITALELNSATVSLLTEHFADYSGHLASNPRVRLVNTEGRSFLAREGERYDLIFFVAPDSYSAQNAASAGAFVLSESYLYTVEMIQESLEHLSDGGLIAMQFGEFAYEEKPNRTARYVGTARQALENLGVDRAGDHVLVATSPAFIPLSTILVKRSPFTDLEVERFLENTRRIPGAVARHVPGRSLEAGRVNRVLSLPSEDLPAWYASQPYDISPVTDDAPFFWHFSRFRTVLQNFVEPLPGTDREDSIGERVLLVLAAVAALFAGIFLLLPFLAIRGTWMALPNKARSFGLFAAIGVGFMLFEVALIQKLVLFLGYPTYSLTVTLMALLVFTGLGSLATSRYSARRGRSLSALLGAISLLTLFYQFGMGTVMQTLLGAPLFVRAVTAVVMLAPMGLVLGAFMPLGLSSLAVSSPHPDTYVAWGWAVNGFFSVIGSVVTTVLSMTYGFRVVLFLGLGAYAVAVLLLHGMPQRSVSSIG